MNMNNDYQIVREYLNENAARLRKDQPDIYRALIVVLYDAELLSTYEADIATQNTILDTYRSEVTRLGAELNKAVDTITALEQEKTHLEAGLTSSNDFINELQDEIKALKGAVPQKQVELSNGNGGGRRKLLDSIPRDDDGTGKRLGRFNQTERLIRDALQDGKQLSRRELEKAMPDDRNVQEVGSALQSLVHVRGYVVSEMVEGIEKFSMKESRAQV